LSFLKIMEPGVVVHACNPSYGGGRGREDLEFKTGPSKVSKTLSQNQNKKNISSWVLMPIILAS
jgi:hypothetical protein